jgi:hypothetical protein
VCFCGRASPARHGPGGKATPDCLPVSKKLACLQDDWTEVWQGSSSEEARSSSEEPKLSASEDDIFSATARFPSHPSEEVSIELKSDSVAGVCNTGAGIEVLCGMSCTKVSLSGNDLNSFRASLFLILKHVVQE